MTRRLGLLLATPAAPRLELERYFAPAIQAPPTCDRLTAVPSWDIYANDSIGDCGPASEAHLMVAQSTIAGHPIVPTVDDVVDLYSRVSHYDPKTGANDNGVVMQDMLNEIRRGGIARHTAVAFAAVNPSKLDLVKAAIDVFGGVLIGANMPLDADTQFEAGQTWHPTTGRNGAAGSWGGHAMHVGYYDADLLGVTTWGKVQRLTVPWWRKYVAECWVVLTKDWVRNVGTTVDGLDLYALGEDLAALTGAPNPIPWTPPTPPPAGDANAALVAAFDLWRQAVGA